MFHVLTWQLQECGLTLVLLAAGTRHAVNWQLSTLLRVWAFVFKRCGLPAASAACLQAVNPPADFLHQTSRPASSSSSPSSPMACPSIFLRNFSYCSPLATPPSSPHPAFPSPAPSPQPSPRAASPFPALAPQPSRSGYVLQVSDKVQQSYADGFLQQTPTLPAPQRAAGQPRCLPVGGGGRKSPLSSASMPPCWDRG